MRARNKPDMNMHKDQASGLRRLMAGPSPRILSLLSATSALDQARLLGNLAASLQYQGSRALILEATAQSLHHNVYDDISTQQGTLLEAVMQPNNEMSLINVSGHGYSVAKLLPGKSASRFLNNTDIMLQVQQLFRSMASEHDVVLVDAALNGQDTMPLDMLNNGEILIHMTRDANSITQAYSLIKQLSQQIGRRSFGIVVSQANEAQAQLLFQNIAEVARNYLYIQLDFMGLIPTDEHLGRAAKLGRSVVDAFPMAKASAAFKNLAGKIDHNHGLLAATFS